MKVTIPCQQHNAMDGDPRGWCAECVIATLKWRVRKLQREVVNLRGEVARARGQEDIR